MSTTITTPDADQVCMYCESQISNHDPICVRDCENGCGSPAYFCNYACLSAHINEQGLMIGDACQWDSEGCC
ncbi:MAG: hypothetical protein J07HQX50_00170 [Haloquadratum sp. J07HQX50]|nr:MAG: hypothetical protein J07HQX50_00170 [Haloquadratum sp. J07HQX50]